MTGSILCAGCGGRNPPGASMCEFCARSLGHISAARMARQLQPLATAWLVPALIALALLSVLILRLLATQLAR